MTKKYYVYILANNFDTTTYIGVTNNLARRMYEHKHGLCEGFSKKYRTVKLVYMEEYADVREAIYREKCLKRWKRDWKVRLINEANSNWSDLMETF